MTVIFVTGLEILAFPCNQFGWQEPGSNDEINEAVCSTFKAEFPLFEKVVDHCILHNKRIPY